MGLAPCAVALRTPPSGTSPQTLEANAISALDHDDPHAPFACALTRRGTTTVVALHGEVDVAVASRLSRHLADAFGGAPETVVVDLAGVTFIDSAGVHLLQGAHARAHATDVRLVLVRAPDPVHRIFTALGLHDVLPFAPRFGAPEHDELDAVPVERRFRRP